MNTKFNIGEQIAYYRRLNAMTQEELAKRLNISTQAVSKWEQKITSPDIMLLPELASIFNISIDELFGMKIDTEPVFNLVDNVPWGGMTDKYGLRFITEKSLCSNPYMNFNMEQMK